MCAIIFGMSVAPKRHISIRLDEIIFRYVKSKPNASRYIEGLIKQDFQMEQKEPLYQAFIARLLKDDEVLGVLAKRFNEVANKPIIEKADGVSYVKDDWGA